MSDKPENPNAYPICIESKHFHVAELGMTLRDYFAGRALAGILADHTWDGTHESCAKACYQFADAMLEKRSMK